jgi:hypothetical protein
MSRINLIFGIVLLFLGACSPLHTVKPLQKGEQRVGASMGGPLIKFSGAIIPIPATSLHYARGISNRFTAYGSVYTTAALFGVAQIDMGVCTRLCAKDSIWGMSLQSGFNVGTFFKPGTSAFWPELAFNYYRHYGKRRHFVYVGAGSWLETAGKGTYGRTIENRFLPWLHLGHTWNRGVWTYQLEARLLAPFQSNQDVVVDYLRLSGSKGVSGIYFSLNRRIGK